VSRTGTPIPGDAKRVAGARPRRGRPEETRARLVAAAAEVFNEVGYRGTDSNRLARAAGYAPGTFYKHFPDKRAAFLAAYEAWVTREWQAIEQVLREGGTPVELAARLVGMTLDLHRRWRGLRASLRALVAEDAEARAFYRRQRRRQIDLLAHLTRQQRRTREENAILLYTLERVSDAAADGELTDLNLNTNRTKAFLRALVLPILKSRRER